MLFEKQYWRMPHYAIKIHFSLTGHISCVGLFHNWVNENKTRIYNLGRKYFPFRFSSDVMT